MKFFFERISWLTGVVGVWLWSHFRYVSTVLLILIRLICWVVVGICLVCFSEKIIFCIFIFSGFSWFLWLFSHSAGSIFACIFLVGVLLLRIFLGKFKFSGRLFLYDVRRTSGGRLVSIVRSLVRRVLLRALGGRG